MAKTKGSKLPLDPKVADKLLKLLSTDNAFRREFKKSPSDALARIGHSAPISPELACASISAIAPKKEIAAASQDLKAYLTTAAALTNPHNFVAGEVAKSLKRR
jgi:putative modified peptide